MGLIKTGLKAAVFVKTAHVVHDRIERRQQAQWTSEGHSAAGAPVAAAAVAQPTVLDQLTQLGDLRANGVLTDAEFEAQKARILAG
jgi:hypothetical protein